MNTESRRFISKLLIFVTPIFLVFLIPFVVLYKAGELSTSKSIVLRQTESKKAFLVGMAYGNAYKYYKITNLLERKSPDVIALGTSRTLQFRKEFFKKNVKFYNAGLGVARLEGFRPFLKRIPAGSEPKLIVIGLDQNFFNKRWVDYKQDNIDAQLDSDLSPAQKFFDNWLQVYKDYFAGKLRLSGIFHKKRASEIEKIGVLAVLKDEGFRNDGSYRYNDDKTTRMAKIKEALESLNTGGGVFTYGRGISGASIKELAAILDECGKRGIYVIGFLPPYPHKIYKKMQNMKSAYRYVFELKGQLQPIFVEHGFGFFDVSDLRELGASDSEALDGYHASEKAYLRLLIQMAKKNKVLRAFVNIEYLEARLKKTPAEGGI